MHICIASDHDGFEMKGALTEHLRAQGHEVEDMGPHTLVPGDDYPDYCIPLAQKVASDETLRGIVIGFSGQGEAMAANRVKGARAAVYYGPPSHEVSKGHADEILRLSREHNNANVLSLGAHFLSIDEAKRAVDTWLSIDFSHGERHIRRITELDHA